MKSLSYLKEYRKQAVCAPLFKLLEASFELFVPLVVADMIDMGINRGDRGYIISRVLILVMLAAVGLGFSLTSQYFSARSAVGMATKLRSAMFKKIQSFSFSQLDSIGTSRLITVMTGDINQLQTGVNMFLRLFLRSPFIVLGAAVMAFYVDSSTALVFVAVIPLLSLIVFAIMFLTVPMFKKVQSRLDRVLLKTKENVKGTRVIRAFNQQENEKSDFFAENAGLLKLQTIAGRVSALMNPATFVLINLGIAALIYTGALRVEAGIITQGAVVALYNYMSQILVELIKLANLIITETKAIASKNRIDEILTMPRHIKPVGADKKQDCFISFDNVSLSYGGDDRSLKNISFTVGKGETVGIIGGTGSGKSSLVHLLCGFYEPTEGEIIVDNKNILNYSDKELNLMFSIVMQNAVMFRGTVRDNILFGSETGTDAEVMKAAEAAQAAEIISGKSRGLDEFILEQGKNLSGGQRQRLAIARAIVRNTPVLILDDSFSALDYKTDKALRNSLKENSNRTTFIISQRTATLEGCDKILVLDDGRLAGVGTSQELLNSCDVYRDIYKVCNREVQ